jgi:hypothetical protein
LDTAQDHVGHLHLAESVYHRLAVKIKALRIQVNEAQAPRPTLVWRGYLRAVSGYLDVLRVRDILI